MSLTEKSPFSSITGNPVAIDQQIAAQTYRTFFVSMIVLLGSVLSCYQASFAANPTIPSPRAVDDPSDRIQGVMLGVDGHVRMGCWTEARIRCVSPPSDGQLLVRAMDGDANWVDYVWPIHQLPTASSSTEVTLPSAVDLIGLFRLGRMDQPVTVSIHDGTGQLWASKQIQTTESAGIRVYPANDQLWLYLGADLNLNSALGWSATERQPGTHRMLSVPSPEKLPTTVWGWDAFERLVGCPDQQTWPLEFTSEQRLAFGQWVVDGGRVSLALNDSWDETLGATGAFSFLVPNLTSQTARTNDSSQIELLVSSRTQLISDPRTEKLPFRSFGTPREQAVLLLDNQPVMVRLSCGLGQVDLLGLDPTNPLLEKWPSRGAVLTRWLDFRRGEAARLNTAYGYSDVTGLMRSALEQFTNVTVISFTSVALIVLGFVGLLIADYFLLRHLLGAMHWTWVTLPLYCLLACLATWGVFRSSKPSNYQVNVAEVVDIDATGGYAILGNAFLSNPFQVGDAAPEVNDEAKFQPAESDAQQATVRGYWWASLYSPTADELSLSMGQTTKWGIQPNSRSLGWLGLPGTGMGGMQSENQLLQTPKYYQVNGQWNSRSGRLQMQPALQSSEQNVPFFFASSRVVAGVWNADFGIVKSNLQKQVGRDRLIGTVTNPLSVELTDCFILYGSWGYRLNRPLGPGETVDLDINKNQTKPESFDDWLRRPNPDIDNLYRILELLTFHEQAGGKVQTRLLPAYQNRLDLSYLSRLDRAVLFGRCEGGVVQLQKQEQPIQASELDRQATVVRIILPVTRSE